MVHLDGDRALEALGTCSAQWCLTRFRTKLLDAGSTNAVSWGRWADGSMRFTFLGTGVEIPLTENQGVHYLIGVPTADMPTSGTVQFTLQGATQATFADGRSGAGTFSGQAAVQFGLHSANSTTKVGLVGTVTMPSDAAYSFQSAGGVTNPAGSDIVMTSNNQFRGNLSINANSNNNQLGCGHNQSCRATINGGFFGAQAGTLGVQYDLTGRGGTINGVAVFRKAP